MLALISISCRNNTTTPASENESIKIYAGTWEATFNDDPNAGYSIRIDKDGNVNFISFNVKGENVQYLGGNKYSMTMTSGSFTFDIILTFMLSSYGNISDSELGEGVINKINN